MSEHIVNFGIVLDDELIKETVVENLVKQVSADILKEVDKNPGTLPTKKTFSMSSYTSRVEGVDWSKLIRDVVEDMCEDWKDEIVERAANGLVESLKRSKKWKEKLEEIEKKA